LKIYREYKNYEKISKELNKEFYHDIAFSHIFTNCLDLFHDLDDTVVDIILNNLRNE
jgi:hypothetical protein